MEIVDVYTCSQSCVYAVVDKVIQYGASEYVALRDNTC
jgi:hypothetical protein